MRYSIKALSIYILDNVGGGGVEREREVGAEGRAVGAVSC